MRATALALLLASSAAHAWEPVTPADVQARIEELRKAWDGKSPGEIARDKLARAKQAARPAWLDRKAWKTELGAVTYYFAVGRAPAAEAGADALPGTAETGRAGGPPASARPLDWYYDDAAGVFYTLVVDAR